ncbi:MAG: cytochrome c biogenesis protein CcsA, partial [Elusimicrobia bacterium]|nr:cytochrome c biogenesis protein CcsA [Candidatus Obscuribacterium magneticum]
MNKWVPILLLSVFAGTLVSSARPPQSKRGFDVNTFAGLPALHQGRVKPLDSIARSSLLLLSGKQNLKTKETHLSAIEWLMEVLWNGESAKDDEVIQIDDPDVLGLFGMEQTKRRTYSFSELKPYLPEIELQAQHASGLPPQQRSRFQESVLLLQNRLVLFQKLLNTFKPEGQPDFFPIPTREVATGEFAWVSFEEGQALDLHQDQPAQTARAYLELGRAYQKNDSGDFNKTVGLLQSYLADLPRSNARKTRHESLFNRVAPFYQSMTIYVAALLLVCFSFLGLTETWRKSSYYLLLLAFVVHTAGLVSRIVLQGRPPVTNLYSSAVFVGWVAVLFGLILEKLSKKGMASLATACAGFLTLIIAHHLSLQGDTMEMLQAVLDSNFWLATHVITITIGYGATFIAGFMAAIYLVRRALDKHWNPVLAESLERMVYGTVCFGLLFSFMGTVLGGIWADQSWGRFWGWDPKENGALLIVLWTAFILH